MADPDWTDDFSDDNPAVMLWRYWSNLDRRMAFAMSEGWGVDEPPELDEESFREVAEYCDEEVEGMSPVKEREMAAAEAILLATAISPGAATRIIMAAQGAHHRGATAEEIVAALREMPA